jgi:hypothetical protein
MLAMLTKKATPADLASAPAMVPLPTTANDDDLEGPVAQAASE